MRVTKAVREYIEQQTRLKAEASVAELMKDEEELKKRIEEDINALHKELKPLVQKLVDKYPGYFEDYAYAQVHGFKAYNTPGAAKYREALTNALSKANQAALEIIVEMELGGTMEDLKKKLDALTF